MSPHLERHLYSLQIHVLEHIGQYQQFVWHWPTDAQGGITLAEVLQELPDVDEVALEQARACKIELAHSATMSVWRLTNFSTELICLHNELLLTTGQSVHLSQGDDIEFGFTHLRISLAETLSSQQHVFGIADPQIHLTMVNPHCGADVDNINMSEGLLEPSMQEVTSLVTIESAQESAAALAELVHLHHVDTMFNVKIQSQEYEQTNFSELILQNVNTDDLSLILPTVISESESLSELIEKKNRSSEVNDPIKQLYQRYLARLRNPYAVNTEQLDSWQEQQVNYQRSRPDEFAHLRDLGGTGDIHELLIGKETTPDLLAHFDQLGETNILIPESFDSVTHLFAPDELKGIASTINQSSIPNLTRLEHHSMAIDSNMDSLSVTSKLANAEKWEMQ